MAPDFKHFDFAKIVDAAGIKAIRVEDPGAFAQPSNRPLRTKGQRSWDVVTSPYELSLPPKITKEQAEGIQPLPVEGNIGREHGGSGGSGRRQPALTPYEWNYVLHRTSNDSCRRRLVEDLGSSKNE